MKTMKKFLNYKIFLIYSVFYLTAQCFPVNCLPIAETISGQEVSPTVQTYYDVTSADILSKWKDTKECLNGSANLMRHINVAILRGAPNHWIQHDALQFDMSCPDGSSTKYTIEFGQTSGKSIVRRRFGYYKMTVRDYKDAKIEFNITELFELTTTQREYSLDSFNSQVYARQTFLKILDHMCAKLGFYAVDDQELYYGSDGPKIETKNFCPNNLFPYHLDQSLLFSKYCLLFLLLIIGSLILSINLYLKYKTDLNITGESTPTLPVPKGPAIISQETGNGGCNGSGKGKTPKNCRTRDNNDFRKGVISYNTFEISKY